MLQLWWVCPIPKSEICHQLTQRVSWTACISPFCFYSRYLGGWNSPSGWKPASVTPVSWFPISPAIGLEVLQLFFSDALLSWRSPPKNLWKKSEVSLHCFIEWQWNSSETTPSSMKSNLKPRKEILGNVFLISLCSVIKKYIEKVQWNAAALPVIPAVPSVVYRTATS